MRSVMAVISVWRADWIAGVGTRGSTCGRSRSFVLTLSCHGCGVGVVLDGWSSALLVSVLMRSSVRWSGPFGLCGSGSCANHAVNGADAPGRRAVVAMRCRLPRCRRFGR